MNRPEKADHQSVFNFMMTLGEPQLCDDEGQFIRQKDDLISLRPGRDDAWLDRMVEKTLRLLPVRVAEVCSGSSYTIDY